MYPATCAACGKETEVPFQPSGDRPVYCRECFQKQRGSGMR
jgi:CxxC-x17-CxxC domain-containing protein